MENSMDVMTENVIGHILRLAPHTEIAHHISGRIRLKLLPSGIPIAKDVDFDSIAGHIPGLRNMRVKRFSGSIVIEYDPRRLPAKLWEDLNQIKNKPDLTAQVTDQLRTLMNDAKGV